VTPSPDTESLEETPSATMTRQPPADVAKRMLHGIMRIRLIEERIQALYAEQEMRCPTHFSIGQEAVAVGVCTHLRREELVTSAHRSHAHYLAKGGDLKAMLAELYGKATGCSAGKGGSMHLIDRDAGFLGAVPIVGSTIPIGVGTALSSMLQGDPRLTVIFFGDGATEAGVFHESLNFAAIHKLPVVMVCENNLYSVLTSLEWRHPGGREIVELARGHGVFSRQGDGNDPDVTYHLTGEAIEQARSGQGPAFLEFKTYRWLEHCGPNDDQHLGYRPAAEVEAWLARDPLKLYTTRLRERAIVTEADVAGMARLIAEEIDDAVAFAQASPFPARDQLAAHLYAP
jgi:TPP-dependent pyruvate/acetoin dehydrogenase alpha subunit